MGCCSSIHQYAESDCHMRQVSLSSEGSDYPHLMIKPEQFVVQHEGNVSKNYSIGALVGSGGYAHVYEAVHVSSKAYRAVKILDRRSIPEAQLNAVLSEVSLVRSLDHPSILKIFEVVVEDETVNIVSEMMTGGDLLERIKEMKKLPERLAATYMQQLLSAVAYCHERSIVHRDLKLENLLLESPSPDSLLKIIDFGCAVKFVPGSPLTFPVGTAFYAAPEVLSENYTEKCDVWSCGVILYMMLSGQPPFAGKTEQDVLEKVKRGRVDFHSEAWEGVSAEAKEMVALMLTKNVTIRPAAKELLHHSWLHVGGRIMVSDRTEEVNILNRLRNFRAYGRLRQSILSFIATRLPTVQETEDLRRMFIEMDADHDGRLSSEEILKGFSVLGDTQPVDVRDIMKVCDCDSSGYIDYTEFITATINWPTVLNDTHIEQAFQALDEDQNGKIDLNDLKHFVDLAEEDEDYLWGRILADVDEKGDGVIDYTEFKHMMLHERAARKKARHHYSL